MVEVSVWRAVVPVWAREIERATLPLQVGYCLDRKSLPQHTTRCVSHSWIAIIKGRGNIDINSTMTTLHHRGDASYLVPTYKWRQADCLIVIPVHNSVIIQVWCWWGIDKKTTHLQHTWSGTTTGFHQWVFFLAQRLFYRFALRFWGSTWVWASVATLKIYWSFELLHQQNVPLVYVKYIAITLAVATISIKLR